MNTICDSISTRKTKECARKSFESVTGKSVRNATTADVEQWLGILREKGRSTSTCRTYLSFVKQLAKLDAELPKRGNVESRTLTQVEAERMLSAAKPLNSALVAGLLLCGPDVLTFTWRDVADLTSEIPLEAKMVLIQEARRRGHDTSALLSYGAPAHFVNGPDMDEIIFPHTAHEVNRRLKTIARKAGIGDANVNITAMKNTRKSGISISIDPPQKEPAQTRFNRDPRLHGMGRRSLTTQA